MIDTERQLEAILGDASASAYTGVVDEHVDIAVDRSCRAYDRRQRGEVAVDEPGAAARRLDRLEDGTGAVFGSSEEDHVIPASRQFECRGPPDPGIAPGDDTQLRVHGVEGTRGSGKGHEATGRRSDGATNR